MYEWAKPGVKVVCINDNIDVYKVPGFSYELSPILIKRGVIYVIGLIQEHPDGQICVKPLGVPDRSERDWGYNINRFRPLIDKKLPESLTILLEKPNRVILPDGGKWDVRKTREKEKSR